MQQQLKKAYETFVQSFDNRDHFLKVTGVEAPPWDPNRPLQDWIDTREGLPSIVTYPRMLTSSELSGKIIFDGNGFAEIDAVQMLRKYAKAPNFIPRDPLVDYGPLGRMRYYPPLIEFKEGQGVKNGMMGDYFEDGISAVISGGSFTFEDRKLLLSIRSEQVIQGERLARVEDFIKGFSTPRQ